MIFPKPVDPNHEPEPEEIDEAFAAFRLVPETPVTQDEGTFHLWPDNKRLWQLWLSLQTQWQFCMESPTGLDYAGVDVVISNRIAHLRQRKTAFLMVQDMERTALDAFAEKRDKKKG